MTKRMALASGLAAVLAGVLAAGAAVAAPPTLDVRDVAVHVIVTPEARTDVQVTVLKTNPRLPIYISRLGDTVLVRGRLWPLFVSCHGSGASLRASVFGRGEFSVDQLPEILVKTPMDARISTGGIVVGSVGRARSLELKHGGCGGWTVANVEQALFVRNSGVGRIETGSAGTADLQLSGAGGMKAGAVRGVLAARVSGSGMIDAESAGSASLVVSGSGDVASGPVADGLSAQISGSGNLRVARLSGPLMAHISGVGHVTIPDGAVTSMEAHISGAGDVDFGGVAGSLDATVSGTGDVYAAKVTGSVVQKVSGAGKVRYGR